MRTVAALIWGLPATLAHSQGAKDDDLASAFGPPPAARVFEPEHSVPAPPLPDDPNAATRAAYEKDLSAAQKNFEAGDAAGAREIDNGV